MAETYTIILSASGPFVGCQSEEEYLLSEYGYTDEDWDALPELAQQALIDGWSQDFLWSEGYEYGGEVNRG